MEGDGVKTCKNCGTASEGWFCPQCGQRLSVHKVTFRETFEDLYGALLSINAPLILTILDLILRPGTMLRNFLEGKRRRYYRPVAFFLLTTFFYIVVRSLIGFDPFRDTSVVVEGGKVDETLLTEARNFMLRNINNLLFVFVFTLAFFLKVFFYRRYSLAEFLAVSFYLLGIYTLIVTVNMFLVQYIGKELQAFGILLMWIYFLYAMASFLQRPLLWILVKSFFLYILAFITYALSSFGLSWLIVYLNQS